MRWAVASLDAPRGLRDIASQKDRQIGVLWSLHNPQEDDPAFAVGGVHRRVPVLRRNVADLTARHGGVQLVVALIAVRGEVVGQSDRFLAVVADVRGSPPLTLVEGLPEGTVGEKNEQESAGSEPEKALG